MDTDPTPVWLANTAASSSSSKAKSGTFFSTSGSHATDTSLWQTQDRNKSFLPA